MSAPEWHEDGSVTFPVTLTRPQLNRVRGDSDLSLRNDIELAIRTAAPEPPYEPQIGEFVTWGNGFYGAEVVGLNSGYAWLRKDRDWGDYQTQPVSNLRRWVQS